ncbi:MAG: DUF3168 domain-containing protein [Pikeienuella sp.]
MNSAALHQAAFTRLAGFTALTSQLGTTGVKSKVPQPSKAEAVAAFPYVTFEFPSIVPFDTDDNDGGNAVLRVHVWARSPSDLVWRGVLDSVYDALHKYQIPIGGANTVDCLFQVSNVMDDPDGITTHAWSDFRITYDSI